MNLAKHFCGLIQYANLEYSDIKIHAEARVVPWMGHRLHR